MLRFGTQAALLDTQPLAFQVGTPLLAGNSTEYWLSPVPVHYGTHGSVAYSCNGSVLFGHLLLDENAFPDLRLATHNAYQQLFTTLQHTGYPYLLRVWNYFPAITAQQGEFNRYQVFCLGRQDALDQWDNFPYAPPAATAIGTASNGLQIYFLAAQTPGMQLENPRQTSAFLYPRQYGPVSPAFSRATVKEWAGGKHIYISGTTSIVGHATQHVGDPIAQLDETLRNLQALLHHGDATLGLPISDVAGLRQLKVYLHDASLLPLLQPRLDAQLNTALTSPNRPAILYLQGNVCRADLAVEIEGLYA